MRLRGRLKAGVVAVAIIGVFAGVVLVGAAERGGPARFELQVGNGTPVTLYLPGEVDDDGFLPLPSPDRAPPVVIVAHGFSADRRAMHTISTNLAEHGYAAAAMEFRGHGSSRHPFRGDIVGDLVDVMDALESTVWVDGSRIALLGHSMGAGAVLDAATRDERPLATVAVSGGRIGGDLEPRRALLLVAESDPESIHIATERIAERNDLRREVIDDTDHLTILFSPDAISRTIHWLDESFDITRRSLDVTGSRFRVVVLGLLASTVVVAAIGALAGRAGPHLPIRRGGNVAGLGALVAALVLAAPILGLAPVALFLPLEVVDVIASYQLLAVGIVLGAASLRSRRDDRPSLAAQAFSGTREALPAALAASAALYVLLAPLLGVFHRVVPTPERALAWLLAAALLFPFFAVIEALVRRGGTWIATLTAILARAAFLGALVIGVSVGLLPGVVVLAVPLLVVLFVLMEIFATAAYATGRNTVLIALVQSVWLGWLVAAALPVTI